MAIEIYKELKGEYCSIKLRSDNILEVETISNTEFGNEEVEIVIENILEVANGQKYYVLVISGEYSIVTVESMKILSSPIAMNYAVAKGYVINSLAQKIMANFFLTVIKPKKPVRFFQNREDAEEWLFSLKK